MYRAWFLLQLVPMFVGSPMPPVVASKENVMPLYPPQSLWASPPSLRLPRAQSPQSFRVWVSLFLFLTLIFWLHCQFSKKREKKQIRCMDGVVEIFCIVSSLYFIRTQPCVLVCELLMVPLYCSSMA